MLFSQTTRGSGWCLSVDPLIKHSGSREQEGLRGVQ